MSRKRDDGQPGYATRVITDRAAYNQYMREYRAKQKRAKVARALAEQRGTKGDETTET